MLDESARPVDEFLHQCLDPPALGRMAQGSADAFDHDGHLPHRNALTRSRLVQVGALIGVQAREQGCAVPPNSLCRISVG
jgi:hypothetical protein